MKQNEKNSYKRWKKNACQCKEMKATTKKRKNIIKRVKYEKQITQKTGLKICYTKTNVCEASTYATICSTN